MKRCARSRALCAALLASALAPVARADPGLDAQIWKPPAGTSPAFSIPDPVLPPHGSLTLGLSPSYARWPLVRQVACPRGATVLDSSCVSGDRDGRTPLVSDLPELEASAALALYDAIQLGLSLPLALPRVADDFAQPTRLDTRLRLSDLRVSVLIPVVTGTTAIAFGFIASLPTGDPKSLVGEPNWTAMPGVVLRQTIGKGALSAALGYRLRERRELVGLEQDDELDAALGFAWPVTRALDLRAELRARAGIAGESLAANQNPVEGDLGIGWHPSDALWLVLGGGSGLWPGREGYGAPLVRAFASLRYTLATASCAYGPEDYDGYRDDDHCRDPDNDGDGIDDQADACPNDAEDFDGFADDDGCPDLDDDADGLPDALDRCPHESEDRDGFEDDDGCPEPDNDGDGIADALDACPMEPEDRDGFEDDDGCPEPGPAPATITVAEDRILISDRIYFDYDRDTLRSVSTPLLDQLASAIRGLPPGVKVVIEGHTDDSGNPAYNLDLSHRRAQAVAEYLKGKGVPADRLDYVGFGSTRPLVPNDSAESRLLNRRVEFRLVR